MDAFVALTNRDEENIIVGFLAREYEIPKVVVKISRSYYSKITAGLSTINPKEITANRIVRYVRGIVNSEGSFVEQLYSIAGGEAEAMEFTVSGSAKLLDIPLKNLSLKKGLIVAAILHGGKVTIPFGNDVIRKGDKVIIVSTGKYVFLDINDILQRYLQ